MWNEAFGLTEQCADTVCSMLPLGYLLLAIDTFFDASWVFWPSPKTAARLRTYYTTLLTPSLYWPGFLFPPYATYKLCYECPNPYNFAILLLFVPLSIRYAGILNNTDSLRHWWTVLVLRVALAVVTYRNEQSCGCHWSDYTQHLQGFWGMTI